MEKSQRTRRFVYWVVTAFGSSAIGKVVEAKMGSADIAANIENWDYTFFYLGENEQEFQALKQEIEADEEVAELVEWHSGMFVGDVPSDNYSSEYWESICEICNLYGVSDQEFEERYKSEHLSFNVLAVDDVTLKESEIYKLVVLLKEQSGHATRQNVYLADMLSDISHQIKTPLTSITIMTELLENPDLPAEKREEFISKINQQVERITWLIKNLLTLSQLEADVLKLKKEKISVNALIRKACQPFEVMAEVKGVNLVIQTTEEMNCSCDIHWTVEAVSNIIKNCIEHTPAGGKVIIFAEQNNFATNIQISDNGEGIAKEHLPHIFERFYKGANTSSNSVGIGLAMSKQIIMRQNGTVSVTSEKGAGTTFQIKMYV